ncbi:MAG: S4 domain-containing protein, partial [Rubrivivax sp.]
MCQVVVDEAGEGQRLDNFLIRHLKGVPKTHVYRIIRSGEVRVNKARAQAETRLANGDTVRIPPVRMAPSALAGAKGTAGPAERSGAAALGSSGLAASAATPAREFPVL